MCGSIRYQLLSEPLTFYVCHCLDCQRRTGGAALPVMWVPRTALRILVGTPVLQVFELGEGRQRRSRVCPRCDTRLWAEPADKPDVAILRPGTLVDQSAFTPIAHLYVRSKQPWFSIPENVAQFETEPDDRQELIRLWKQSGNSAGARSSVKR
ncbi:GFA family protein [Pararobbsia alpina]|uniref:GFA family protein n=1 Tax=Pararobbsia alpina TaxID=621374 RepID=UPI0039A4B4BE